MCLCVCVCVFLPAHASRVVSCSLWLASSRPRPPDITRVFVMPLRAACELSVETCEALMKAHVRSLEDEKYKSENVCLVCAAYESFLVSCAAVANRLTVAIIEKAAAHLFGNDHQKNHLFAQRMALHFHIV